MWCGLSDLSQHYLAPVACLFCRKLSDSECSSSGVWGKCQGQGKSQGERAWRVQRGRCLPHWDCKTCWGGGANGDGPDGQGGRGVYIWVCVQSTKLFQIFPFHLLNSSLLAMMKSSFLVTPCPRLSVSVIVSLWNVYFMPKQVTSHSLYHSL